MAKPTPRLPSPSEAEAIRDLLATHGFTAKDICARRGCRSLATFKPIRLSPNADRLTESGLDILILLFLDEEYISPAEADCFLGLNALAPFVNIGLVYEEDGQWASSGLLYPIGPLWIASDRNANPDGTPFEIPTDAVYPAITEGTLQLVNLLPDAPSQRFLEACAGTGVAAVLAATQGAEQAWACDINPRAAHYAALNAALNATDLHSLTGNHYEPVAGLQFDRIVAHPPYVPQQSADVLVFRDGGSDGEQVIEHVIAGCPDHLAPGGRMYVLSYGTDREQATYPERIRQWLGDRQAEFDLLLYAEVDGDPAEVVQRFRIDQRVPDWPRFVAEQRITGVFYGLIVLQRIAAPRPVFTERRLGLGALTATGLERLLILLTSVHQPAFLQRLSQAKLRLAPGLVLQSTHAVMDGELTPTEMAVQVEEPVFYRTPVPAWVVRLLQTTDGRTTAQELHAALRRDQFLDASLPAFVDVLRSLLQFGILEVAE
jgi:SAM-dependent methyltransferase